MGWKCSAGPLGAAGGSSARSLLCGMPTLRGHGLRPDCRDPCPRSVGMPHEVARGHQDRRADLGGTVRGVALGPRHGWASHPWHRGGTGGRATRGTNSSSASHPNPRLRLRRPSPRLRVGPLFLVSSAFPPWHGAVLRPDRAKHDPPHGCKATRGTKPPSTSPSFPSRSKGSSLARRALVGRALF